MVHTVCNLIGSDLKNMACAGCDGAAYSGKVRRHPYMAALHPHKAVLHPYKAVLHPFKAVW